MRVRHWESLLCTILITSMVLILNGIGIVYISPSYSNGVSSPWNRAEGEPWKGGKLGSLKRGYHRRLGKLNLKVRFLKFQSRRPALYTHTLSLCAQHVEDDLVVKKLRVYKKCGSATGGWHFSKQCSKYFHFTLSLSTSRIECSTKPHPFCPESRRIFPNCHLLSK